MNHPPAASDADAFTERIVREVIRRLLAMGIAPAGGPAAPGAAAPSAAAAPPYRVTQRLITAAMLHSVPPGTTEVLVPHRAVITPLARDEAKELGLRLTRLDPASATPEGTPP